MARGNPIGAIVTAGAVALVGWFVWARFPAVKSTIKTAIADIGGAAPQWTKPATTSTPGASSGAAVPPAPDISGLPLQLNIQDVCGKFGLCEPGGPLNPIGPVGG